MPQEARPPTRTDDARFHEEVPLGTGGERVPSTADNPVPTAVPTLLAAKHREGQVSGKAAFTPPLPGDRDLLGAVVGVVGLATMVARGRAAEGVLAPPTLLSLSEPRALAQADAGLRSPAVLRPTWGDSSSAPSLDVDLTHLSMLVKSFTQSDWCRALSSGLQPPMESSAGLVWP